MAKRKTERRRQALLHAAERAIRERYGEFDLGLADIAEAVGTSSRQVQRVFREVGDTDFRSYLLRIRMEHAHRLLSRKTGLWSSRKVARAVGYREASGLRWQFKRFYGYNPSEAKTANFDYDEHWRAEERRQ